MKLLLDENIDTAIVDALRDEGHEVRWIAEIAPSTPDPDVLTIGHSIAFPLVTFDVGIGPQAVRRYDNPPSIAIIRIKSSSRGELLEKFALAWARVPSRLIDGQMVTAYVDRVRVRRLPSR